MNGAGHRAQDGDETELLAARLRRIGAIAWPSFFAAAVASIVFFAVVDPMELADITWPHLAISREFGYSIGFHVLGLQCSVRARSLRRASARDKRASGQPKQPAADDEPSDSNRRRAGRRRPLHAAPKVHPRKSMVASPVAPCCSFHFARPVLPRALVALDGRQAVLFDLPARKFYVRPDVLASDSSG
jgi:hypothetical protein